MKNIFAFTETTMSSPGYISVNQTDDPDVVSISVRTRTAQSVSSVAMSVAQLVEMAQGILTQFPPVAATTPAPVVDADAAPKARK